MTFEGQGRFLFLDAMRGVGAFFVMIYHFTEFMGISVVPIGFAFVDFFFILSGLVITHGFMEKIAGGLAFRAFFLRRITRLYPLYLIGLSLGAIVLFWRISLGLTDMSALQASFSVAANLFYLPWPNHAETSLFSMSLKGDLFPANSVAWSLFFELAINVLFFYLLSVRKSIIALTVLVMYLVFIAGIFGGNGLGGWNADNFARGFLRVYYGFFTGYLLYFLYRSPVLARLKKQLAGFSTPLMLLVVLASTLLAANQIGSMELRFALAMTLFPLLVFAASFVELPKAIAGPAAFLGALSYPVYCLHFPVQLGFDAVIRQGYLTLGNYQTVAAEIATTLVISIMALKFVEKPLRTGFDRLAKFASGLIPTFAFVCCTLAGKCRNPKNH